MQPCKHKNYCRSIRKENSEIIHSLKGKYVFFIWVGGGGVGGGLGPGYFRIFCEKSRGPPTSWNGLMHDPSETPKQKHLIPSPPPPSTCRRQK